MTKPRYWDDVVVEFQDSGPMHAWRCYMNDIYLRLIQEWFDSRKKGLGLKTDLFEEAVSTFSPLTGLGEGCVGLDLSLNVVRSAVRTFPATAGYKLLVADLRNIPFLSGSIDRILSGSSLDHFSTVGDLTRGLSELVRILSPGGTLVLTLDNPDNPVIWIRNHLPFDYLNRLGIVPYYVGKTMSRKKIDTCLKDLGMNVIEIRAVAHAPRAPAILITKIVERFGWKSDWITTTLHWFERMAKWPFSYLTGYYVAVRAEKPEIR